MLKCSVARVVVAMLVSLSWCAMARGADVWRMAGTFNGWNTRDDAWALLPVNGNTGVFALERTLTPGSYSFKFVKNGDWAQGHLGLSGNAGLEQPGADITLRIAGQAVYRVTLDANARTWTLEAAKVEKPVLIARVLGEPRFGATFAVDASESLYSAGSAPTLSVTCADQEVKVDADEQRPLVKYVTPSKAGKATLKLVLTAGETTTEQTFDVNVEHLYELHMKAAELVAVTFPGMAPEMQPKNGIKEGFRVLEPMGSVARVVIGIEKPATFSSLSIVKDKSETLISNQNVTISKPGLYAAEVRNGEVVTHEDQNKPFLLNPGNWQKYSFVPREQGVSRAALSGDFNRWAGFGSEGAMELASKVDGSFWGWVNIPDGAHRYCVVTPDGRSLLDPGAAMASTGPDGRACSVMIVGKTPADYPPAKSESIEREAVRHDPASSDDVLCIEHDLGLAELSVRTLPDDVQSAVLMVELPNEAGQISKRQVPMIKSRDLGGFDRWTARVMTGRPEFSYSFGLIDGANELVTKDFSAKLLPDARLDLPSWAMGAVWYQIFPERFRNGNPLNDPHGPGVFMMKWDADWYKPAPGEGEAWKKAWLEPGAPMPRRTGGEIYNYIWDRRYGGDLQGIVEKLEDLKKLGVTALYLNPVFEAQSMHKYDATDFRHIDDNFAQPKAAGRVAPDPFTFNESETEDPSSWVWSKADEYFVNEFLPACKRAGMKVVLDGVFNHTGRPFYAFKDIEQYGSKSRYKDWFYVEFDEAGKLKAWQSWANTGALPKFKQEANGDLVAPVKKHIFDITTRWMDPNGDGNPSDGIDGWRLDVALDVGLPFWKDWRAHVKKINPDAVIIAEIWEDAAHVLTGDAFDTQMNYPFATAVTDWLSVRPGMTSDELGQRLRAAFGESAQTCLIHQNLFCSHDTDRYVSMLWNPNRGYDQRNRLQDDDGQEYNAGRPPKDIYDLSLLGVAIQATYLGAPMIYYGDEVGMWGADDPTNRKPYPWPDQGRNANKDDEPLQQVKKAYMEWFNLRQDREVGPILRYGSVRHLATGDAGVFAFTRELNGHRVVVVVNRNDKPFDAAPLLPEGTKKTRVPGVDAKWFAIDR